jgi:hypothetical protein
MVSPQIESQVVRLRSLLTALKTLISAVEAGESDLATGAYGSMLFLASEAEQAVTAIEEELTPSPDEPSNDQDI